MFLRQHERSKDGKEHSYWSLVETVRTADGPRQRTLCYLGELNGSAHARWQKTVEVFNEQGESTQLKLFPSEVEVPDDPNVARVLKFLLTRKFVNDQMLLMLDVEVIADPTAAAVALEPVRSRLLAELTEPASAATLAGRLGIARQKINYHLRTLEEHRLVEVAEKRKWGGLTERLLVATAASYVVSPEAMGPVATDPGRTADRLSAGYLIALAARVVREVSDLLARARKAGKRLATLSVDSEVRFRSAEERAEFSRELTAMVASLVARYHDASAPGGRRHRLVIVAHPLPQTSSNKEPS